MSSAQRVRPVAAVNRMTAQWIRSCRDESSVFCAPSAWPLLALLAGAAEGRGRRELEHAVGLPSADSRAAALELLALLRDMTAVRSALGVWVGDELPLHPSWTSGLPLGAVGSLTGDSAVDAPVLDEWAREKTGGLIDRMPIEVDDETLLVLAAAMAVRTRWVRPFTDNGFSAEYEAGPWLDRSYHPLSRVSMVLDRVNVAPTNHGEITCLEIVGKDGITVHLVIGEEGRSAAEVLGGGLLARTGYGRKGGQLKVGDSAPGLVVERVGDYTPGDRLLIRMPRFRVNGDHDLLEHPEVFGLDAVTDSRRGHFPAMGPEPLAVSQAKQSAMARFSAEGFEAAAVTAIVPAAIAVPTHRVKQISVELDRPFGFFASHRTSGLILAAGWVAEPEP